MEREQLRQAALVAVLVIVGVAGVLWALDSIHRKRLTEHWLEFVRQHPVLRGGEGGDGGAGVGVG